jgi:hypothetical protein
MGPGSAAWSGRRPSHWRIFLTEAQLEMGLWLQSIVAGLSLIAPTISFRETYPAIRIKQNPVHGSTAQHLKRALLRPTKLILMSLVVFFMGLYTAVIFGYFYPFLSTFPSVFHGQHHFSIGESCITYLGLAVGSFTGLVLCGKSNDIAYKRLEAKNGAGRPEYRLPPLLVASPYISISLFWYGWSIQEKAHWIVPIIGTAFFSLGMMPAFVSHRSY